MVVIGKTVIVVIGKTVVVWLMLLSLLRFKLDTLK